MSDVELQDWPEGKRLRITYCHGKDEPRLITSYAGKWRFFEPVSVEIEPHPEGFYIPARDYDRQAAEIARLRAACDASDERVRAIELRFWQTVDRDGLTGLPSDMWAALNQLVQDRAALATARREEMEGFGDLVASAYAEAIKAMRKFPQPNYVISKIAEEAGEVVKAAIHCAEKRETAENVAAEMKQLLAMLIRLWVEGDQVHGLPPIAAAIRAAAKEVK